MYAAHLRLVQLGQDFASRYQEKTQQAPKPAAKSHCKRELMHAVWSHLMDEEFVEACTEGIAIKCVNSIKRQFFVHIITYSVDYPEK